MQIMEIHKNIKFRDEKRTTLPIYAIFYPPALAALGWRFIVRALKRVSVFIPEHFTTVPAAKPVYKINT